MRFEVDTKYLLDSFQKLVNTPSPVGYSRELKPVLEGFAQELGHPFHYDNKNTFYMTIPGEDSSKTVMIGGHVDTLGLVVRTIDSDGMIRVRALGGVNYNSLEGEFVTVHTRDGRTYTGLLTCQSHSVHVFDDARTAPRDENTMMVILDEKVSSKADVTALGIRNGDVISMDPRCTVTEKGYLKSRFIDDKAGVACIFTALKYMKDQGLSPKYNTLVAIPFYEEIGLGGTYVPEGVSEFVAVDIGLIGPGLDGNEYAVSICAKDNAAPYDYDLTSRMIEYAEKAGCDYNVDIYYHYSTDANAAMRAGNNLKAATFGMAVYCSHGMERTHVTGLQNTVNLTLAYLLDI